MKLIYTEPNQIGAYQPIQSCNFLEIPQGMAIWPEELSVTDFYAHNGFVTLDIGFVDGVPTVTSYEPNMEAWEDWKASLPEEPSEDNEIL